MADLKDPKENLSETISKTEYLSKLLESLDEKNRLANHKLFALIKKDELCPSNVANILRPFYFAVYNWTYVLTKFHDKLLAAGDNKSAALVKENIMDELGYENGLQDLNKCHTTTFLNFLFSLGALQAPKSLTDIYLHNEFGRLSITRAVIEFNNALEKSLNESTLAYHACVLGGIEHFYIRISNILSTYCTRNNINLTHYATHEIVDQKHSMDFFQVALNQNVSRTDIDNGIAEGCHLLDKIYLDLYVEFDTAK